MVDDEIEVAVPEESLEEVTAEEASEPETA